MTKNEYLKLAILAKKHYSKKWLISAIALVTASNTKEEELEHLDIIYDSWGYSFWDKQSSTKIKIDDAKPGIPLFNVKDRVIIDHTWFSNVNKVIDTPFGNVLFNAVCIYPAFGSKMSFITGQVSIADIERRVAEVLTDTPKEGEKRLDTRIYCDEWRKFIDSREHLSSIVHLLNQSATVKTITKAPGFEAFKAKLTKEYEGQLEDPVKLVEYEKKLQAYDNEWLKGDPADKTFLQGKVRNVARKKMHLSIGSEPGFEVKSTVIPITKSLDQGWPTDPEEHVSMMNGIRYGSLSRGKETVKGGVTAKYLLRAGNNFTITDEDCGARNGLVVKYDSSNISRLVGRFIINEDTSEAIHIKNIEDAREHQDKYVRLRSPAYCRQEGDSICRICAGDGLSLNPKGVSIGLTEMSSIVMNDFMKAMHDTTLKTEKLELSDIMS